MTSSPTAIGVLIGALGGEGGGVLAQWLVEAATAAGFPAQSTSIPGVAQRTGATTYYVEIFPRRHEELGGREPVLSLYPVPGRVDLVVCSELLEAGRIVGAGLVSPDRTVLVTSTSRTLTTAEKMAQGDGRFASDRLLAVAAAHSQRLAAFDMEAAARDAGTAMSAVMFGAACGSGVLPFGRETCEAAIREAGRGTEASLSGFARGYAALDGAGGPATAQPAADRAEPAQDAAIAAFPAQARDVVALGLARVTQFQDAAYGGLYLARLQRVLEAERASDPGAAHDYAMTREAARFLALWMAFDDVVRVAALKVQASRAARVRREVGAQPEDIVRIVDHFKPGVPEIAGLLPPSLGRRLLAWDRARQARGKPPFALALKIRTDGIAGLAALRVLAAGRRWRRCGGRYAQEQAAIEAWLAALLVAARDDWACGHEIALCGRLIKGYGATNERGKRNLAHIVDHLATGAGFAAPALRAAAIRDAREAALADEGGKALDRVLVGHGAPPREPVARPIRWMRKPRTPSTVPKA